MWSFPFAFCGFLCSREEKSREILFLEQEKEEDDDQSEIEEERKTRRGEK